MKKKNLFLILIITFFSMILKVQAESIFDDFCLDRGIKSSLKFIGYLIFAIKILVPIIIMLMGTIDLLKAITANDDDQIKKNSVVLIKRLVMGILIFFIPTIISVVFSMVYNFRIIEGSYNTCLSCITTPTECEIPDPPANSKNIVINQKFDFGRGEDEISVPDTEADVGNRKDFDTSSKYPNMSISRGKFGAFPYNEAPAGRDITIDSRWVSANIVTISVPCDNLKFKTMRIHRLAQPNYVAALNNICKLTTQGINGIKLNSSDIIHGGSFVSRKATSGIYSNHAWGIATDFNYAWSITVNGKTFKPYSGQGSGTKRVYDNFVKELGKEEDSRNVNYILWVYAFKPAGFKWGGDWSDNYFDPMHYEVDWKNQ